MGIRWLEDLSACPFIWELTCWPGLGLGNCWTLAIHTYELGAFTPRRDTSVANKLILADKTGKQTGL